MASSFSPSLRAELIGSGDQSGTWGSTTNSNFQYIFEAAIAGYQTVAIAPTSNNQVLTYTNGPTSTGSADQSVYAILKLNASAVSANFSIFTPPASKQYVIWNNTSYTATFYNSSVIGNTTAAGSGVTIPIGAKLQIWSDGTNFYPGFDTTAGNLTVSGNLAVTGTSTFTGNAAFSGTPTAPTASAGTNTTQLATTAFVSQNAVLTGALLMWPTVSAPSGYLACDGAAVSRSTYAALFAIVSTTFGSGDGTTTFNLPNYTGRMPYGATIGSVGGSVTTTISSANLPGHTHTFSGSGSANTSAAYTGIYDSGHSHSVPSGAAGSSTPTGPGGAAAPSAQTTGVASAAIVDPTHFHSVSVSISGSTGSTGSGTAATTISPYLGINFIIKT